MLIGIISDTHDNQDKTRKAIELFNSKGVEYVIHAGDYISPFTLKLFKELMPLLTADILTLLYTDIHMKLL